MYIARCKSWAPTNKVIFFGFDSQFRQKKSKHHLLLCSADLEWLYSPLRSIFFSFIFKTKKLKLSELAHSGDLFFSKFTNKNDNPTSLFIFFFTQNWMGFTNLSVQNFTLADSLEFTNNRSLSPQDNFALCQVYVRS